MSRRDSAVRSNITRTIRFASSSWSSSSSRRMERIQWLSSLRSIFRERQSGQSSIHAGTRIPHFLQAPS
jgi:hypothetical protein